MRASEPGRGLNLLRTRAGPLCRMVSEENDALTARYDRFRDAWDRRDVSNAFIAFDRFRQGLLRHLQWEEDSLFREWEKHLRPAEDGELRRHRAQHQVADRLSARVEQLIARRMGIGPDVDDELVIAVYELENLLASHHRAELHEVCCRLDAILSDEEVDEVSTSLRKCGRIES